jgi:hypothetical protein
MRNWEQKFRTLRPRFAGEFGGEARYDAFVSAYLRLLRDPDALSYSTLFMVQWNKPAR